MISCGYWMLKALSANFNDQCEEYAVTAELGQVRTKRTAICDATKADEICHRRWREKSVELRWDTKVTPRERVNIRSDEMWGAALVT